MMSNNYYVVSDEEKILLSRLDDLITKASGGSIGVTQFLNPRQAFISKQFLLKHGYIKKALFWGGYSNAERTRLFLLPEYLTDILIYNKISTDNIDPTSFHENIDTEEGYLQILKIAGSGYVELSHRDYLGSILGLGLKRDVIGDIILNDKHSAFVIVDSKIALYIIDSLEKVSSDKVSISKFSSEIPTFLVSKSFKTINDTVSSCRIDCIIASVLNLSREDAQKLIKSEKVEVDYSICSDVDCQINIGSIISAKGYGKFIIRDATERTKKDKIRLVVDKYI